MSCINIDISTETIVKEKAIIFFDVDEKTSELKAIIQKAISFTSFCQQVIDFTTNRCLECFFAEVAKESYLLVYMRSFIRSLLSAVDRLYPSEPTSEDWKSLMYLTHTCGSVGGISSF